MLRDLDAGQPLTVKQTTLWGDTVRRFFRNKAAMVGLGVLVFMLLYSTFGPCSARSPSTRACTRIRRSSLTNCPTSSTGSAPTCRAATCSCARPWGAGCRCSWPFRPPWSCWSSASSTDRSPGFAGGKTDDGMMRFVDILYGLPYLPFAIILLVILGSGVVPMLLALAIVSWLTPSRLVRGQILTLKQNEYVEAARALGAPRRRIIFRHLLPNTLGIIVVAMFLEIPGMIIGEAILSFLGLGISAPNASWGTLAQDGWKALRSYPWLIILPGFFIAITVLSFNFVGDGFRDAIDPRTKETK